MTTRESPNVTNVIVFVGSSGEEDDSIEVVHIDEDFFYMEHVINIAAVLHSVVSLAILIGYYHLKVLSLLGLTSGLVGGRKYLSITCRYSMWIDMITNVVPSPFG